MHDVIASPHDLTACLARLQRLPALRPGVVTVYLDTAWSDEHQRDRTRVFLTREVRRARDAGLAAPEDLDWIEHEGRALVDQADLAGAHGVALFAARGVRLREVVAVRVPFEERFVVDEYPDLGPLAALLDEQAPALVVFVDGETARLIPLTVTGGDEEVRLASDVPGHHRRGGWAQLAQSRYARHIETHRARHFDAVARAVTAVVDARAVQHVVLAGEEDQRAAFRDHLPDRLQRLVVAEIHAARWEAAGAIGRRAAERLALEERSEEVEDVDDLITAAAKGDRAVAGSGTLAAAGRGAIHRLYILAGFRRQGRQCEQCGTLAETGTTCPLCGDPTRDVELGAALVDRVLRTGGSVEMIAEHAGLAAAGGVAARLRYPMTRKDGT